MTDEPDGWGLCKECKWWQIEPEANSSDLTLGVCIEKQLKQFKLRISGLGGCNRFQAGEPTTCAGASGTPPAMDTDVH